jgi:iron complex transport system substrate-binding protein
MTTFRTAFTTLPLFILLPLVAFMLAMLHPTVMPAKRNGFVVMDMNSRRIPLAPPAQRVIILPPILSDYLTIDKGSDHVVAGSKPNITSARLGLTGKLYPNVLRLPITGPTVDPSDPEIIMRLKPDAVLAWSQFSESLKMIGLTSLVLVKPTQGDVKGQRKKWQLIGKVAGKDERADKLWQRYMIKRATIRNEILSTATRPVRVVILNGDADSWWIASGKNYYLNEVLDFVGATNCAESQAASLAREAGNNLERLLILKPDVILLNSGLDHGTPWDIYRKPELQVLKAVREHKVYLMPNYFDTSMVAVDLLLRWTAEILHPSDMSRKLRGEYRESYRDLYDYSVSDSEIDDAIFLKENMMSVDYDRFARHSSQALRYE